MGLRPCGQCRRHVRASEVSCPFCRAELAPAPPRAAGVGGRLGRAAVFAGATVAGSACWSQAQPQPRDHTVERDTVDVKPGPLAAGTIRGFVRDGATGRVLPSFEVTLMGPDGSIAYAISDRYGEYVFANLPPGEYIVQYPAPHPRQSPLEMPVTLGTDKGQHADLTVYLPEPDRGPCCKPYGAPPARRRVV